MCGITGIVAPAGARVSTERLQRMTDMIAGDHAALGHHRLGGAQAALPVFVIDQRQDAFIAPGGFRAAALLPSIARFTSASDSAFLPVAA